MINASNAHISSTHNNSRIDYDAIQVSFQHPSDWLDYGYFYSSECSAYGLSQ